MLVKQRGEGVKMGAGGSQEGPHGDLKKWCTATQGYHLTCASQGSWDAVLRKGLSEVRREEKGSSVDSCKGSTLC